MFKHVWSKLSTSFLIVLTVLLVGTTAVSAAEWEDYNDVSKDNVHYDGIKALTEQDIFKGYDFNEFKPWENFSRQHAAVVLFKAGDFEKSTNVAKTLEAYKDINSKSRYAEEIAALTEAGVFKGDEHGNFNPYGDITRQQMASVLVLAMDLERFDDLDQVDINLENVSASHKERVQILANLDLTTQLADFRPKESISRGAIATLVYKSKSAGHFDLSVLHMNDTHARADKLPNMITAIDELKEEAPDSLVLHGGDVFSGTLYFTEHKGQADLAMLNLMDLDAMVFGNHEFDLGDKEDGHESLAKFVKDANFPLLNTNVDFSEDPFMKLFDTHKWSIENAKGGNAYKSIIKEVDGEKVGIFGLTTEDTVDIASPMNVKFSNYIESAKKAVAEFKAQEIDKIISVNHIGYNTDPSVGNDILLAENVEGIDIIVGGHSHTPLEKPDVITKDKDGKAKEPTVIVQAGEYAEYLGTLDVQFDENGVVVGQAGELIEVADYDADEEALKVLAPYTEAVDKLSNEETGANAVKALENPRESENSVRSNETELGNLITDAMLAKAQEKEAFADTVIAFQNGGGIRADIDQGPISVGEVINVLPFGNNPVSVKLSGEQIKEILEHSVRNAPEENGGFLHVSGMKFEYDSSKKVGDRVVKMEVNTAKMGDEKAFEEITADETYLVTTNGFTGQGGDGFKTFAKAFENGDVKEMGEEDWQQLRDYLVELGDVDPEREGRIVDVAK